MFGGFRKKNKRVSVRKRVETKGTDDESDEGEMANDSPVESPKPVIPKVETKSKIKKSASALSFGDELNDNEEFVIKKSKASLNMQEQVKKEKKKKKKETIITEESEILSNTGESSPPSTNSKNNNGSVNRKGQLEIRTFEDDEEIDDSVSHRFSSQSRFGRPGDIPDAATIYAMKKQREHARQSGGQNFIPLNSNTHAGRFSNANSRLVREEMEMNSSDEDRIEMKGKQNYDPYLERRTQVAKALEEAEEMEEEEADSLQDEEFRNWENEQINKATKIPASIIERYGPSLPSQQLIGYSSTDIEPPTSYSIPNKDQTDMTVDYITKKLAEELSTKKQLHHIHNQDYEKIKFDLESSKNNITDLEEKAAQLEEKFSFFQDTRGFSKDLLECLAEKVNNFIFNMNTQSFLKRNSFISN